jgi:hypothetical protein
MLRPWRYLRSSAQISPNLLHRYHPIHHFSILHCLPTLLRLPLKFLQPSLVWVFLLFQKLYIRQDDFNRTLICTIRQLSLYERFYFGWQRNLHSILD